MRVNPSCSPVWTGNVCADAACAPARNRERHGTNPDMQPHQGSGLLEAMQSFLEIVEGGADMARRVLATDLDAKILVE